jgi:hypothetical protein
VALAFLKASSITKVHSAKLFDIIFLMNLRHAPLLPILLFLCSLSHATDSNPTIGFTLDFPGANPSHYEIVITDDGQGSYSSNGQLDEHSDAADPVPLKFDISDSVRTQIFDLAKKAHYFKDNVDSGRNQLQGCRPQFASDIQLFSSSSGPGVDINLSRAFDDARIWTTSDLLPQI